MGDDGASILKIEFSTHQQTHHATLFPNRRRFNDKCRDELRLHFLDTPIACSLHHQVDTLNICHCSLPIVNDVLNTRIPIRVNQHLQKIGSYGNTQEQYPQYSPKSKMMVYGGTIGVGETIPLILFFSFRISSRMFALLRIRESYQYHRLIWFI